MVAAFMHSLLIPIQSELPDLLHASREDSAWVITITLLVSAICVPISGRLGDMYGKRTVILVLLGLLTAGSLVCALSDSLLPMIIGRGLQGVGMGVIPLGIALLHDVMPENRVNVAVSLVSATLGVGAALGLPVGAIITAIGDWHILFWVSAGLCITVLVLCLLVLPTEGIRSGGRFDYVGALGLAVCLTALLLVLSNGNQWGWAAWQTLVLSGCGLLVFVMWGWYQLRRREPLIDVRVSLRRPVLMTNLASIAMGFALFASHITFPQLLSLPESAGGLGASLLVASVTLMPSGLAMLAMSPISGRLMDRVGPKSLLILGAATIAATYIVALLVPTTIVSIAVINAVLGAGIGLGYAAMPTLVMRSVPDSETAAGNGLNTLMRALGTTAASAVIAAVLAQSAHTSHTGYPTGGGFQVALLLGCIGGMVSIALAIFIPSQKRFPSPVAAQEPQRSLSEKEITHV
ncbi:Multidrug resistance protein stp [Microbacterium terrae]|uniref:Multidrug resistance protein stp n=2 Tax=Microbacterium terrae TaxID=69369 RepID=A0A0M2HI71_9MICO|nr:MFS transporter [Microbacterium terrae]KJL44004.1 Multidrug resistance protein stp [Microbacterium terrae]